MTKATNKAKDSKKDKEKSVLVTRNENAFADIFSDEATRKQIETNKKERESKALAKAQRENKINNTLLTATIKVKERITKTAMIEIALSVAARTVQKVSCQQIETFLKSITSDNVMYRHESSITTRVRNHARKAMKKLVIVDKNDMITLTQKFCDTVNTDEHIKRVDDLLAEIKAENTVNKTKK